MKILRTSLILGALIGATPAVADDAACLRAVEQRNYSAVLSACVELPHGQRGGVAAALVAGDFTHHLGGPDTPSRALRALHTQAGEGDRSAQYTYGLLYKMVFVEKLDSAEGEDREKILERNAVIVKEAMRWIKRAAIQDHALAMLDVAKSLVEQSYSDPELDLKPALSYAQRAHKLKNPLAEHVVDTVKRRMKQLGQG